VSSEALNKIRDASSYSISRCCRHFTHEMNLEYYYYRMTAGYERPRKMSQISGDDFESYSKRIQNIEFERRTCQFPKCGRCVAPDWWSSMTLKGVQVHIIYVGMGSNHNPDKYSWTFFELILTFFCRQPDTTQHNTKRYSEISLLNLSRNSRFCRLVFSTYSLSFWPQDSEVLPRRANRAL
jgi:hypothetical protein